MSDNPYPLFYDGIMDAINKMVHGNPKGLKIKQIAMDLWPSANPDTARSAFSRAINENNTEQNLTPEELITTMKITEAPEHIIYCLCDEFGFERPPKRDRRSLERNVTENLKSIQEQMKAITKMVSLIDSTKERGGK